MIVRRAILLVILITLAALSQESQKRYRGDGLYRTESANTVGSKTIWISGRGVGFVWDATKGSTPKPFAMLEVKGDFGFTNWMSGVVESRVWSYLWNKLPQFGWVSASIKATTPNNKDLRFDGMALKLTYIQNVTPNFVSLGGYRIGGTGFGPEGFMAEGPNVEAQFLYERDFLAQSSDIPIKAHASAGIRIPLTAFYTQYSQYLLSGGLAYVGLSADVFVEYSLEAFFNTSNVPKKFEHWFDASGSPKTWEVAFSESPMYLTPGGRVRYDNGMVLSLCVPILLSVNKGSDMTYRGDHDRLWADFPEEQARGIKDPFDPWYAKWKVVAGLSFPLRYRQTASEMRRTFLLMKNSSKSKKIDIDERLKALDQQNQIKKPASTDSASVNDEADRARRLEEIKKRRQEIQK